MDWATWVIIAAVAATLAAVVWLPLRRSWNAESEVPPPTDRPGPTSTEDARQMPPGVSGEDE